MWPPLYLVSLDPAFIRFGLFSSDLFIDSIALFLVSIRALFHLTALRLGVPLSTPLEKTQRKFSLWPVLFQTCLYAVACSQLKVVWFCSRNMLNPDSIPMNLGSTVKRMKRRKWRRQMNESRVNGNRIASSYRPTARNTFGSAIYSCNFLAEACPASVWADVSRFPLRICLFGIRLFSAVNVIWPKHFCGKRSPQSALAMSHQKWRYDRL